MVKRISVVIGSLLVLIGVVWILQGFNVLGGSFMSGQRFWAGMGGIAAVVGAVLLLWGVKRESTG